MKTAIALGTFDGLHQGHRAVIEKTLPFYSIAVTFYIPPKNAISDNTELLIMPDDREERLKTLGVNQVVMQNFDAVRNITALDYLENLKQQYNPSLIACGFNYRFGKDAQGDTALLADFCKKNNIEFCCVPAQMDCGNIISSTQIRNLIKCGEVDNASKKLFGGFGFKASVSHGDERGRTIGFPTANQHFPDLLVKPKFGVYISRVTVDGKRYSAITNIGLRPTYKTDTVGCETYIKNFDENIYGKEMKTELLKFVRPEKKFDSLAQLTNAIKNDVKLLD